jgi:superfamily II DNA or RNA helicase
MITLRPYQRDAIAAFRQAVAEGDKRLLLTLPCGTGKTITGLALAKELGARTLWLAHRDELIEQPLRALAEVWPEAQAGVVKAERNEYDARDVVFASVQTAWRDNRLRYLCDGGVGCGQKPGFDLVVADECHHATARSWRTVVDSVNAPLLLGLTATPERTDQARLNSVFDRVVYQLHMLDAIKQGYLVDVEIIQRKIDVDLDAIGIGADGDFVGTDLDAALLEAGIVGEIVAAVREHAADRRSLIFVVSVRQAEAVAEALGSDAAWVCGATPIDERRDILRRFAAGEIRQLANCMVLTEGFDDPGVDAIVMARPTTSKSLAIQMIGRGLRLAPMKANCLILDLVGTSKRHTLVQAPVIFGLAPAAPAESSKGEPDPSIALEMRGQALLRQIRGVAPGVRSALRWVGGKPGEYALSAGQGGTIIMRPVGDLWVVEVVGGPTRDPLTSRPVDQSLALGVAEDYVRRCSAIALAGIQSERWRQLEPTGKQIGALKRAKVPIADGLDRGQASDLLTHAKAADWRNDPATEKQITCLRRGGADVPIGLTKGAARGLIWRAR